MFHIQTQKCHRQYHGCWFNRSWTVLLTCYNRTVKVTGLFKHVSTVLFWVDDSTVLFIHDTTCKIRHVTTAMNLAVVTALFNPVISSCPDNMLYHVWTILLIQHDGFWLFKQAWTVLFIQQGCSYLLALNWLYKQVSNGFCRGVGIHKWRGSGGNDEFF